MRRSLTIRCRGIRAVADAGMTTAEYCVGTLAACPQHTSLSSLAWHTREAPIRGGG
ncbi:MAG: DUF4244 domain-containing protein [Dermatophilaceae bacterium]